MNKFIYKLYEVLPKNLINEIGKSNILKPLRDKALRENGNFKSIEVKINRDYSEYHVEFSFNASFKIAEKAKNKGIENTLLRNSFKLLSASGIRSDAVVFDVGANFGYLSLVWADSVCRNNGNIYSFEPNPSVFRCFEKSVLENNLSGIVKYQNKAVGRKSGKVNFYFSETTSNMNNEFDKSENSVIGLVSIDDFIKQNEISRCDMIKIDVDGIEFDILNGAAETLDKFKPLLIIETNNDRKIMEYISKNNYKILDMKLQPVSAGGEIPTNIFCLNNDIKF